MKYHMAAFFFGFLLDMLLGDPYCFPHPVRLIGMLIETLEKRFIGTEKRLPKEKNKLVGNEKREEYEKCLEHEKRERKMGAVLVVTVSAVTGVVSSAVFLGAYLVHPYLGVLVESIMTYQLLAAKCLKVESMKVYKSLTEAGLLEARKAVSMIVGRDTEVLDEEGVIKAAVETVAENTSDGCIAPMLYTALGGPVLGFLYKAVNTMDSMIGYKNEKYLYFGRAAAKTDDIVNYIPSRISAYLMILAAFMGGREYDGRRAYQIYKRDRKNHASPNSAQTESVCAGALGVRLAGDASYFGKIVKKKFIGDDLRNVEVLDIKRANHLMYLTTWFCEGICLVVMSGIMMV